MKVPALLALLALAYAPPARPAAPADAPLFQVGRRLPELELPTLDGARSVRLSELARKRTLLIQFASW